MRFEDNLKEFDDLIINLNIKLNQYELKLKDKEDELENCKKELEELENRINKLKLSRIRKEKNYGNLL